MHRQRLAKINKQKMAYSKYLGKQEEYEVENGEIVKILIDGKLEPVGTGTYSKQYSEPVEFMANISSTLNKLQAEAWGVSQNNIYAQIVCAKDYLPLEIGDKIWRKSEVRYLENLTPDPSSADYTVECRLVFITEK